MNRKSLLYTLFIVLFFEKITSGQNVNSDTIFVSTSNQTVLTFKSEPKAVIVKGAEDFDLRNSEKQVRIHPRKPDIKPTGLRVVEDGRIHNFIVTYKQAMNLLDASYNFSYLGNTKKDTAAEAQMSAEEIKRIFDLAMEAYQQYDSVATIKKYEEQIIYLKEFLRLISIIQLNPYQYSEKKKFANDKINKINNYLSRIRGASYQSEAIPYSESDLEKKYSGIDFNVPPPDQVFSRDSYPESVAVSKQMLSENTKKKAIDSAINNNIKLTYQAISKKDGYVYLRYGILNSDSTEFVAGAMQLFLNNKKKKIAQFSPVYISSFPIVLPGKEFVIVYVTKDFKTEDNENLVFEINNRFNNIKLQLTIPGSTVNKQ